MCIRDRGVELARLEERACALIDAFADTGPTAVDMEAVLAQTERSWLSGLASLEERADAIGHYTCLYDDPHAINTYLDRLGAVSADQVQQAASEWLRAQHRSVVAIGARGDEVSVEDEVEAVSYTHLDVYKRQVPRSSAPVASKSART